MFTGIIAALGQVTRYEPRPGGGARLTIAAAGLQPAPRLGDSIAVNGCCLTVERAGAGRLLFSLAPETVERTALKRLQPGERVSLEPALRAGDPLGGHWVQGHIEAVGTLLSFKRLAPSSRLDGTAQRAGEGDYWLSIRLPAEILPFVVWKGSLAVEGISLTVARLEGRRAGFAIIPYTCKHTHLATLEPGAPLNLEADILARYLARWLEARGAPKPRRAKRPG